MKKILVVCSGNTCRSPMAEGLIRARLEADQLADEIQVASAGVRAVDDEPASQHGVALLAEREISLHAHRSRRLSQDELNEADLVLVMTAMHRHDLRALVFPEMDSNEIIGEGVALAQMHKVLLFSELLSGLSGSSLQSRKGQGRQFDISDPYGESKEVYLATLLQLDDILEQGWPRLLWLCGEPAI